MPCLATIISMHPRLQWNWWSRWFRFSILKIAYRFFWFKVISQQLQQQLQQQQHQQQQPFNQNFQAESVDPDDVPAQHGNIQPGLVPTEADAGSSEKPTSVV